jgi:hypothetical protein
LGLLKRTFGSGLRGVQVSRTKSGGDPLGRYDTPAWAVHVLLDVVGPDLPTECGTMGAGLWLEPCAGNGAIINAVYDYREGFGPFEWDAIDIEPRGEMGAKGLIARADFLSMFDSSASLAAYDVTLSNPPYKHALAFATRCVEVSRWTSLLLRLNWLAGAVKKEPARGEFLDRTRPDIFILPDRPVFTRDGKPLIDAQGNTKKGGDATEYAWVTWHPECSGRYYRLPTTPKAVRRPT